MLKDANTDSTLVYIKPVFTPGHSPKGPYSHQPSHLKSRKLKLYKSCELSKVTEAKGRDAKSRKRRVCQNPNPDLWVLLLEHNLLLCPQDQTTAVASSWKPKDSVQMVHDALRSARSLLPCTRIPGGL